MKSPESWAMTLEEAAAEATRRWGKAGGVRDRGGGDAVCKRYAVGPINERNNMSVWGEGNTLEEAFAEAAERADFMRIMDEPGGHERLRRELDAVDSHEAVQRALAAYHDPRFRLESEQSRMSRALAAARGPARS